MKTKALTQYSTDEEVYVVEVFAYDYHTKQLKTHTIELITKDKDNAQEYLNSIAFVAKTNGFGMLEESNNKVVYSCKAKGFLMKHVLGNYYLDYSNTEI